MCRDLLKCNKINLNKDRDGSDEKKFSEGRLQTLSLKFKIRALMHRNIRNEVYKQIAKGIQYSFEKENHSFSIMRGFQLEKA